MSSDTLTFLSHSHNLLAKTWKIDGAIKGYDKPKFFTITEIIVEDIRQLSNVLSQAETENDTCLIRGKYVGDELSRERDPAFTPGKVRRIKENFNDLPLHTVLIEVDKYEPLTADPVTDPDAAIREYVTTLLPPPFRNTSYHWQLSSSAGHKNFTGILKAHLWFWLKNPATSVQLKAWAKDQPFDSSVFNVVQVHYTSNPVFEPGVMDPVAERSGFYEGQAKEVDIEIPETAARAEPLKDRTTFIEIDDPFASWLLEKGLVKGEGREGQLYLDCPFPHPSGQSDTDTAYLPAGSGGFFEGRFSCLHQSCQSRLLSELEIAVGYVASGFTDLGPAPVPLKKFQVLSLQEFVRRPPTQWLIKGVLPAESFAMIFGGSGDGKTFVAIDKCMAIARGIEWNGRKVRKGRVVYVCAEGSGDFIHRLNAYCIHHKTDLKSVSDSFGIITDVPNFRTEADAKTLALRVQEWGKTDLVVIDTLAQTVTGADENSSKDMSIAVRCCETLRRRVGGTVELIHHAGKDEDRGARGWSGLKGPLDAQFQVYRENDRRVFWVAKEKGARDNYGWSFNLVAVPLSIDEDGDLVESLCVEWMPETKQKNAKEKPLGDVETIVRDTFYAMNTAKIEEKAFYTEVKRHMPDTEGRDRKGEYIGRALRSLAKRNVLQVLDGFIIDPSADLRAE